MSKCYCPSCKAQINPGDWILHQRQFHSGEQSWHCSTCSYSSTDFGRSLAHALLEGHRLGQQRHRPVASLIETASSPEVYTPSLVSEDNPFSPGQELSQSVMRDYGSPAKPTDSAIVMSQIVAEDGGLGAEGENDNNELTANIDEEYSVPDRKFTIQCAKCHSTLSTSSKLQLSHAKMHVRSCCNIREYACSSCGHLVTLRSSLTVHFRKHCRNAVAEQVDMERCAKAEEESMAICFPGIEYKRQTVPVNAEWLNCAKCNAKMHYSRARDAQRCMLSHVLRCFKIYPFACSTCDFRGYSKKTVVRHIRQNDTCHDAKVQIVDKATNERAITNGIVNCFPENQIKVKELHL